MLTQANERLKEYQLPLAAGTVLSYLAGSATTGTVVGAATCVSVAGKDLKSWNPKSTKAGKELAGKLVDPWTAVQGIKYIGQSAYEAASSIGGSSISVRSLGPSEMTGEGLATDTSSVPARAMSSGRFAQPFSRRSLTVTTNSSNRPLQSGLDRVSEGSE